MSKIIEYTIVSLDGVFAGAGIGQFHQFRDDAYFRDGLGQLLACDAMLMGRTTYEGFANLWPGRDHPWADAINAIRKYVFSSSLERAEWSNSVIIRGDVVSRQRSQASERKCRPESAHLGAWSVGGHPSNTDLLMCWISPSTHFSLGRANRSFAMA